MGRYYSGDIDGKFWFAIQSSDAADRFGVTGQAPNHLEYFFDIDDLEDCKKEIKAIEEKLGDKLKLLDDYYNNDNRNPKLSKAIEDMSKSILSDYADLVLGRKIRDRIELAGYCNFNAEL